jgi:hypothetical protein
MSFIGPIEPLKDSTRVEPSLPARRVDRRRSASEEENRRREQHQHPQDEELDDEAEDDLPHVDVLA